MKKSIFAAAIMALSSAAVMADSVYQWGAWDVAGATTVAAQTAAPVQTNVKASSGSSASVSADVVQLTGTSGAGPVTDQALYTDLANLKAGNVVATFVGSGSMNTPVTITADFGKSTWSGRWDFSLAAMNGVIPVSAGGNISGANISGTVAPNQLINLVGGSVSGVMSGAGVNTISGSTTFVHGGGASFNDTFTVRR